MGFPYQKKKAGEGNRTPLPSLGSLYSTDELRLQIYDFISIPSYPKKEKRFFHSRIDYSKYVF